MRPGARRFASRTIPVAATVFGLAAGLGSWAAPGKAEGGFSLRWIPDPDHPDAAVVEVRGVDGPALRALEKPEWPASEWARLLPVYAGPPGVPVAASAPSMLGRYSIEQGVIRFRPRFPLAEGVAYRAIFRPAHLPAGAPPGAIEIGAAFVLPPPPEQAATVVAAVFPSSDVLPENLLKFYIHFSAPMQRGRIYDQIHLFDAAGKAVEMPFLELNEELWNPDMTRLTLFIDPGRIKRGVRPLEEIGPTLEAGRRYVLVVDAVCRDSRGRPLRSEHRKSFGVAAPDRDPPDPAKWKLAAPAAGSRDPLKVTFSGPMDQALALRMLRVVNAAGALVDGTPVLSEHEERWTFTPATAWRGGRHHLRIPTTIEDLAGNNIGKPFEVDLFEKVERRISDSVVTLPFEVRGEGDRK